MIQQIDSGGKCANESVNVCMCMWLNRESIDANNDVQFYGIFKRALLWLSTYTKLTHIPMVVD